MYSYRTNIYQKNHIYPHKIHLLDYFSLHIDVFYLCIKVYLWCVIFKPSHNENNFDNLCIVVIIHFPGLPR